MVNWSHLKALSVKKRCYGEYVLWKSWILMRERSEVKGFCFGKMNFSCLKLLLWIADILHRLIGIIYVYIYNYPKLASVCKDSMWRITSAINSLKRSSCCLISTRRLREVLHGSRKRASWRLNAFSRCLVSHLTIPTGFVGGIMIAMIIFDHLLFFPPFPLPWETCHRFEMTWDTRAVDKHAGSQCGYIMHPEEKDLVIKLYDTQAAWEGERRAIDAKMTE